MHRRRLTRFDAVRNVEYRTRCGQHACEEVATLFLPVRLYALDC